MPHSQAHQPDHTRTPRADLRVTYHGTITTLTPLTDRCREWVEANVDTPSLRITRQWRRE